MAVLEQRCFADRVDNAVHAKQIELRVAHGLWVPDMSGFDQRRSPP